MAVVSTHSFQRSADDTLIVVPCRLDKDPISLALDTRATHDLTSVLMAGYELKDAIRKEQVETASGVVEAHVFRVKRVQSLGITRYDFEILAYDFLAYQLLADFEGVLGLNFFEGHKFCIDLHDGQITVERKF